MNENEYAKGRKRPDFPEFMGIPAFSIYSRIS